MNILCIETTADQIGSKAASFNLGFFGNVVETASDNGLPDVLTLPALQLMTPGAAATVVNLVQTSAAALSFSSSPAASMAELSASNLTRPPEPTRSSGFTRAISFLPSSTSPQPSPSPVPTPPLSIVSTALLSSADSPTGLPAVFTSAPSSTGSAASSLTAQDSAISTATAPRGSPFAVNPSTNISTPVNATTTAQNAASDARQLGGSRGASIAVIVGSVGGALVVALLGYALYRHCRSPDRRLSRDSLNDADSDDATLEKSVYGGALAERIGGNIRKVGPSGRSYVIGQNMAASTRSMAKFGLASHKMRPMPPLPPIPTSAKKGPTTRSKPVSRPQTQTTFSSDYTHDERYSVPIQLDSDVESFRMPSREPTVRRPILSPARDEFEVDRFTTEGKQIPQRSDALKALWDDSRSTVALQRDNSRSRFSGDTQRDRPSSSWRITQQSKKFILPFPRALKLPKRATTLRQRPPTALQNAASAASATAKIVYPTSRRAVDPPGAATAALDTANGPGQTIATYLKRMVGAG